MSAYLLLIAGCIVGFYWPLIHMAPEKYMGPGVPFLTAIAGIIITFFVAFK